MGLHTPDRIHEDHVAMGLCGKAPVWQTACVAMHLIGELPGWQLVCVTLVSIVLIFMQFQFVRLNVWLSVRLSCL